MKHYVNQTTGLAVVTGKIDSISEDRMVMVVKSQAYDRAKKVTDEVLVNVTSNVGFDESFKPGFSVMAAGYQRGKGNIVAECASIGNESLETPDLAVVSGLVKFARLNEEKNTDGTPKMKADGVTPKKPHFDITITVNEGGKYVDHIIKVYANPNVEAEKSPMAIMQRAFKNFDNKTNRIRATFVTQPGNSYSNTVKKDGKEYVNHACSHIGYKTFDLEYVDQKEKTTSKQTEVNQKAPEEPVAEAPTNNGFDEFDNSNIVDPDYDGMFH